ncbi:hypothetical protein PHAVU_004G119050 [Phaseolus vulgaris]
MVRTRGRDGRIVRRGQPRRGVSTSMHGELAIDLGNLPYSGEFRHAYPHPTISPRPLSIPVPPGPSSSAPTYHQSVPEPLHQTQSFPLHPTSGTFVQPTPGTLVQTTPYPIVHTTSSSSVPTTTGSVQGLSDHVDHGATAASEHNLPPEEVQRDPTGRVIIRLLGRGWTPNHFASEAIGHCIRSQFRGPYHHYDAMPEEDKLKWWTDFQDSNIDVHQLDPATKLQTWKEVVGGKSRGRVYGTTDLAANIRQGVSSLTQASAPDTSQSGHVTKNQMLHAKLSMWSQKYAHLEDELKVIKDKLISMERDKTTSNSTTQFDHEYDPEQDDQPVP